MRSIHLYEFGEQKFNNSRYFREEMWSQAAAIGDFGKINCSRVVKIICNLT